MYNTFPCTPSMALSLHTPKHRFLSNYPLLHRHFSSSSSNERSTPQEDETQPNPNVEQTSTAYLQTLKKSLAQYQKPQNQPSDSSQQPLLFQDVYKRNVISKPVNGTSPPSFTNYSRPASGSVSLDKIRESLKKMERRNPGEQNVLRGGIRNVDERSNVIGGALFGKEMKRENKESVDSAFCRQYSHEELGEKLRRLRPAEKSGEKGWFSLQELNERLKKLKEWELNDQSTVGKLNTINLRESLSLLKLEDEEKLRRSALQNLSLIGKLSSSSTVIQLPPKEHLLEKYLHPDNMSTEEKMKIELAKVRDEFKISESDCGSARVQVAQLTTKIKHLSAVLHKKDKHSRKGLQEMVQRRKKLLKYLRRTDWDSYCFVISKLGLRDNPDFKESHKKRLS